MILSERARVRVVFGSLGALAVLLVARLADMQVAHVALSMERRDVPVRPRALPAPRGTIVDARGEVLAFDRPVFEVRVEVLRFPGMRTADADWDETALAAGRERLVADLLWGLSRDTHRFGDAAARDALRATLDGRVRTAIDAAKAKSNVVRALDILVDRALDDASAVDALRALDVRAPERPPVDQRPVYDLFFHVTRRYERVYAEPLRAVGIVGTVQSGLLERAGQDGRTFVVDDRRPVSGLERLAILEPRERGREELLVDALSRGLWTNRRVDPEVGVTVHTTIERGLQVWADIEVERAADSVTAAYGSPPEWGALVLVDVADGGILAAASYTAAKDGSRDRLGAFAPTQRVFEPGSVVKPLHVALALDRGVIDWNVPVDCTPGYTAGSEQERRLGLRLPKRVIRDSHPNHVLSAADVLVRSSNIGAVRLGLNLGPEGIEEYLRHYRFGSSTECLLPGELAGHRPAPIPQLNRAEQLVYAGPSVLFGYQLSVTPLQVARAFLTFLSGRERELHLVKGVEADGEFVARPADADTAPFLRPETLATIKGALVGVVQDEHGTARAVGQWLRSERNADGAAIEIAGKTGTSQYVGATTRWNGESFHGQIRTSSFVGFSPVDAPRYLVMCVLQKAGADSFYGGTYAAPAASRLLVRALERANLGSTSDVSRSGLTAGVGRTELEGSVIR